MLVIFSGLPGVGKTTIARPLARAMAAVHLRVDTIEYAIWVSGVASDVADAGYRVAWALAEDHLKQGLAVVADSVNPLALTRQAWQSAARTAGVASLDVEVICSDITAHRRRVESRISDIAGFVPPTWEEVVSRDYQPWTGERLVIDTAHVEPVEAVERIRAVLDLA
ncbi:MAG TPA: AAA family ATPase [Caulobacteraceae bacterium]|jgi:predicted kinase